MYDDDEDDDDRSPYAMECGSVSSMTYKVKQYLQDPDEVATPLSDDEVAEVLAKDEAQKIIESAVSLRSYVYYAGNQVYELARP